MDSGLAAYGLEHTVGAMQAGAVKVLLLSKDAQFVVPQGGQEKPVAEWAAAMCEQTGAEVQLVAGLSEEGAQFVRDFGIGAVLRFAFSNPEHEHEPIEAALALDVHAPEFVPVWAPAQAAGDQLDPPKPSLDPITCKPQSTPENWEDVPFDEI